ncbi:MAG: Ig-like domain-containing protein [bacterium]|nr:Ig-like domain-containing protein [bacterium]
MKNLITKSSKVLGTFLFTLLAVFTVACMMPNNGSFVETATRVEAAAKINKSKVTLPIGASEQLKVNGTSKKATWKTTDKKVATVSSKGKVTAKKAGSAKIQAKLGKKTYTCKVNVLNFKLNKSSVTMTQGKTTTLKVSGTKSKVTYKSSNKKIATVTNKGVVKAVKKGSTNIKVKVGKQTYTLPVKVETPSISKKNITLKKGNKYTLKLNGTSRSVRWSTNNSKVATVSNGKVTAKAVGQAIITAKVNDKSYTCKVVVGHNVINCPDSITIKYGETKTYTMTATDGFTYSSENRSIASATINPSYFYTGDKLTMKVTGYLPGTTNIVFKSDAGWTKKCKVTVIGAPVTAGAISNPISNVKINSIKAYKSVKSKEHDIFVMTNITSNVEVKLKGINIKFGFYDKNGKLISSTEKGFTNILKGKQNQGNFIEYDYGDKLKDVTSVKIISVTPIVDDSLAGKILTNPKLEVSCNVPGLKISNVAMAWMYGSGLNYAYGSLYNQYCAQFQCTITNTSSDTKYYEVWFDCYDAEGKIINQVSGFNYESGSIAGHSSEIEQSDTVNLVGALSTGKIAKIVFRVKER